MTSHHMRYNEFFGMYSTEVAMQLGWLQTFVLIKGEDKLTLECRMSKLKEKILSGWIVMGVITISMGFGIISGLVHLRHDAPRGVGIVPLIFGCLALGASYYRAGLASTVTFDLRQNLVTIAPMWHLGRKQTFQFNEIQSLHAVKNFVLPYSFIGRKFWYDYWSFSFSTNGNKKILFAEGYPPKRQDEYIAICIDTISSLTGIQAMRLGIDPGTTAAIAS